MANVDPHQDVLQFLQDLDSIVPTDQPASTAASATISSVVSEPNQDVMSFLNELDSPTVDMQQNVPAAVQAQAVAHGNPRVEDAASAPPPAVVPTVAQGGQSDTPQSQSQAPARQPGITMQQPMNPSNHESSARHYDERQQDSWGWNVGRLWSRAQQVSTSAATSLTKSLETAKHMAEETAKAVSANEKVKGLMNKEGLGKLGNDITRFTQSLADTLAPPIDAASDVAPLATTVSIWLSAATLDSEAADTSLDALHDFVQATVNDLWLNQMRLCSKVAVNSVKDPGSRVADSFAEAAEIVQTTILRLRKLAEAHVDTHSPVSPRSSTGTPAPSHQSVFLVIQPVNTLIGSHRHLHYMVFASAMDKDIVTTSLSQSVVLRGEKDGLKGKWEKSQKLRVLETVLADCCEEFGVRCLEKE
ncbi:hypothetical protein BC832DRAFT_551498 [Gaertneriomyces semiglobifer]|nr:hypothetical protein BC832DRAFT_551498 [Gaertneriomyces semiglobifer]